MYPSPVYPGLRSSGPYYPNPNMRPVWIVGGILLGGAVIGGIFYVVARRQTAPPPPAPTDAGFDASGGPGSPSGGFSRSPGGVRPRGPILLEDF